MTKTNTIRAAALAALVATPFASVPAAGPFQVRRSSVAQEVSTAPPIATVATSPYDEDVVSTFSVSDFYYEVYDASGVALAISVQLNPVTQVIRIGFDDGNPASAPVSASASSLAVVPSTILADGLQSATITVVPRDADGVRLGTGLSISLDASLLWPAQLSGPIVDLGDGSYEAHAVAIVPGTGTVRAVVEGVGLSAQPTIVATPLDPSGSLRDLAISMLAGLAGPAGPLSTLQAEAGEGSPQAQDLAEAIARANAALATLVEGDTSKDENVLKIDFDAILTLVEGVMESPGSLDPQDVRDVMDDLIGIARLIVQWHIDRASDACGVCDGSVNTMKVCYAVSALDEGDALREAVDPDWGKIVDVYAQAVEWALQAFHGC
jgi:hypothetical protein